MERLAGTRAGASERVARAALPNGMTQDEAANLHLLFDDVQVLQRLVIERV